MQSINQKENFISLLIIVFIIQFTAFYFRIIVLFTWLTLELIILFVNLVFRISALWFISHTHENASLWEREREGNENLLKSLHKQLWFLARIKVWIIHIYLSTLDLREHKLELSSSGTISILCKVKNKNQYFIS